VAVEANGPLGADVKGRPAAVVQYNTSGKAEDVAADDRRRLNPREG
jgi:hypothetical protein